MQEHPHSRASDWDVIVCGSGPAGSTLARRLANQYRVLLLDRPMPQLPVRRMFSWRIGESLPGAAAVLLRRQGMMDRFLADVHVERGASVSVWETEAPVWFDAVRDPNGPGWHLERERFDTMLRDSAHEAGANRSTVRGPLRAVREMDKWNVLDLGSGARVSAKVLVDATGRSASLCRTVGLRRRKRDRLACVHAMLPADPLDRDGCTRICADHNGWWYSVRVPSGRRVLAFHLDADDPALKRLRNAGNLLALARHQPILATVLPKDTPNTSVHVTPAGSEALDIPTCAPSRGFYAIGDAVLACDPLSSLGLFHALSSAESAATAIRRQFDGASNADLAYWTEMRQVQVRYQENLDFAYAGPVRYRSSQFWARRCGLPLTLADTQDIAESIPAVP